MNVKQMRIELAKHFGAASAFSKSLDKKPDNQIIAIYYRLKGKGELK